MSGMRDHTTPTAAFVPPHQHADAHGLHFNPRQHVLDRIGDKHELVHPQRLTTGAARHELKVNRVGTVQHPDRYEFKINGLSFAILHSSSAAKPLSSFCVAWFYHLALCVFAAFGKEFHLDVDKNQKLLHPNYKDVVVHGETMEVLSSKGIEDIEHCYFIGRVVGMYGLFGGV